MLKPVVDDEEIATCLIAPVTTTLHVHRVRLFLVLGEPVRRDGLRKPHHEDDVIEHHQHHEDAHAEHEVHLVDERHRRSCPETLW